MVHIILRYLKTLKVFPKIYCGATMIESIANGTLYMEFLDIKQQYEMTNFAYYRNANTGSFQSTTIQFQ